MMEIYQNLGKFLDNSGSPFFVGSLVEKKVLFINKIAKEMFGCTEETCDFEKIFEKPEERLESLIVRGLTENRNTLAYNYTAVTADKRTIVVDLQFGYFNEEKTEMFLEIIPQNDTRLQMAMHQIQNSPRAEAILNLDEKLSIVDCNEAFHQVFESSEELRHSHFKNDLVNGFLPEVRESLISEIHKTLANSEVFSTELKVFTATREEKWYRFDLQKRELDNSDVKLMCYMVNIEKQVEIEEKFDLVNQYLSVIQESTVDLLYRVNIATNTMFTYSDFISVSKQEKVISNYVNVFLEKNTIHPEDKERYLKGFKNFYEDNMPLEEPVRFSLGGRPYQWYKITGKKIFDKDGNLKEVFGALVNVDKEVNMKEQVSSLTKYFEALQEFSTDVLYRLDVPNLTLHHVFQSDRATEIGNVIPDYINTLVNTRVVHPEDAEVYVKKTMEWLADPSVIIEARFSVVTHEYEWYRVKGKQLFDDEGNLVEIVGVLVNIQQERDLEKKYNESKKYFKIMQELSDDILYRVDVDTMTLHHNLDSKQPIAQQKAIPDYVNTFIREKIVHPDDVEQYLIDLAAFNQDELEDIPTRFALYDDEYHWYKVRGRKIYDEKGNLIEIWGRLISQQEEKKAKLELNAVSQQFNAMQKLSSDILFHIEIETQTFYHNEEKSMKYGLPTCIPNCVDFFIEKGFVMLEDIELYREKTEKLLRCEIFSFEVRLLAVGNVYDWHELRCEPLYDENGKVTQLFGRLRNIQCQRNLEERAYHDLMTGTLNKVSFEEEVSMILNESTQEEKHALIFIDLDDFKGVNDTLGHSYGDALLTTVGNRLKGLVRSGDLVGRIGGDEFAVMLRNIDCQNSVLVHTNRMLESLQQEFTFENQVIVIKASVGISLYPSHGHSYKELISKADMGVYESKRRGKNVVSMYDKECIE